MINSAIQANVGLRRISRFLALEDVDGRDEGADLHMALGEVKVERAIFDWKTPVPSESETKKPLQKASRRKWWARGRRASIEGTEDATPVVSSTTAPLLARVAPNAPLSSGGAAPPIDPAASTLATAAATSPSATLSDITMSVRPGELAIICGPTGCGKSSLLAALLGDCPKLDGRAVIRGRISYCPQRAWLANATLRANVLFGTPFDSARYEAVLDACALRADIALLPHGDATEIGERGVNLSGGQQQRINLARACYAQTDVVLLDDVLSAVDAHVGAHIFEQCVLGFLAGRTRVLVTHAVALTVLRANVVVAMQAGTVLAAAPPDADIPEIQALVQQAARSSSQPR